MRVKDSPAGAPVTRRRVVTTGLGAVAATIVPAPLRAASGAALRDNPFTLGVASGYPQPDGMVLWTRLAPQPLVPGGGLPADAVIPVTWEIAGDERFGRIVQSGTAHAAAEWAHSVHVEPTGLLPDRDYWYRFRAGNHVSPPGRTRTSVALGAALAKLRLAVVSCQQYEHGYYAAYRHIVADDPGLVVHLGDYIYELTWGTNLVRSHGAPECYTLDDYRARYALYKSDPDLQAAHAAAPWLLTWDDHEVDNDYAADADEENDPPALFLARRAAAYRAYYEHLPLPRRAVPFGPYMRIHAARACGDLARIVMLDGRQYRSRQACATAGQGGGRTTWCEELFAEDRTMLGAAQEDWLGARLARGGTAWNLIAQQTVMTRIDEQGGPGERYWTDSWNGYPAARARLMGTLGRLKDANPVVLSGDIHAFGVANLNAVAENPESPIVASEFVTTSVTSQAVADKLAGHVLGENPNLLFGSPQYRGYLRLDLTRDTLRADLVALDDATRRDSGRRVLRSYVVESGRPGPKPA